MFRAQKECIRHNGYGVQRARCRKAFAYHDWAGQESTLVPRLKKLFVYHGMSQPPELGTQMKNYYTILVADDHLLMRAGIRASLRQVVGYEVVAETTRPDETLDRLIEFQPRLLILDSFLCQGRFPDWLAQYQQACPELKILILSRLQSGDRPNWLSHQAVAGSLLRHQASEHLLEAVRVAAAQPERCSALSA